MVLAGRPPHQGKASEVDNPIHQRGFGIKRVVKEGVDRLAEIQATAKHRNDRGAAIFQFLNHGHIMGFITGDDVAALQHQPNDRPALGFFTEIAAAAVPVEVFLEVFKHAWGKGMPKTQIGKHNRFGHF